MLCTTLSLVRIDFVPPGLPKLAKPIPSTGTTNTSEDVTRRLTVFFRQKNRDKLLVFFEALVVTEPI